MFECDLDGLSVKASEVESWYSLRFTSDQSKAVANQCGQAVPQKIGEVTLGTVSIAMLGPDEFLLSGAAAKVKALVAVLLNTSELCLSLIDISDRDQGFAICGVDAAILLAGGCPLDLEAMKSPAVTRTLFDRVQVVVFKDGADSYRLYCARSFASHLEILFAQIAAEIRLGV